MESKDKTNKIEDEEIIIKQDLPSVDKNAKEFANSIKSGDKRE
jgi:hypothetical protein